jgi:hypothetical protein
MGREEEGSGHHFTEDVPLFSTPRPHSVDFVHDEKVTEERPLGGKQTPLPCVAGSDPVTEGPMHEMLHEMKQWRESQDQLSQTLLAKLSGSAEKDVTASRGKSEETTPRCAERSNEMSLVKRNHKESANHRVWEETTPSRKSPLSRREGKDNPSKSVSSVTTLRPRGMRNTPPPKWKSKGRSCCHLYARNLLREKSSRVFRRHHAMEQGGTSVRERPCEEEEKEENKTT